MIQAGKTSGDGRMASESTGSLVDGWIDEIVPAELEWKELVRSYPLASVLVVAAGGFYLGAVHGARIVEALTDLASHRVEETADRLRGAARDLS
jgi:hypothetical protein